MKKKPKKVIPAKNPDQDAVAKEMHAAFERLEKQGIEPDYAAYIFFSVSAGMLHDFLGEDQFHDLLHETMGHIMSGCRIKK